MLFVKETWSSREYSLDKMTLRELVAGYFTYPGIQVYLIISVIGFALALIYADGLFSLLFAAIATGLIYPLVWYLLHRFVLHGAWLYKSPRTASVWKRIHFDHHQDPHKLEVLFGALYTTIPTVIVVAAPLGWLIGGFPAAVFGVTAGLLITCFYEFCHCIQHLRFTPNSKFLMHMKKRHLAHHFHSERGNFGITNFMWDRMFGTYYPDPKTFPESETTFNLGYRGEEIERYPWVARLSGIVSVHGDTKRNSK